MSPVWITPGILLSLTLAFGLWLSHAGKPYNGLLFNAHKLAALGAAGLTAVQLAQTLKHAEATASVLVLAVLAALGVIALFASGALISMGKLDYGVMRIVHRLAPVLAILAAASIVHLLGGAL
jgi:hypothetical protein